MASSNDQTSTQARAALEQLKSRSAREVGVTLKQGYNGDLSSRQAGSIGGQMVKTIISQYKNSNQG